MQTISFFRASMCNSSYSAFKLALCDNKNIDFARRIIIAKNESAHNRLSKQHSSYSDYLHTKQQAFKYNSFLTKINFISGVDPLASTSFYCSNIKDFKSHILIAQCARLQ